MSAREFKFGQPVRIKGAGDLAIYLRNTGDGHRVIVLERNGDYYCGLFVGSDIQPSAQPHVAAGSGFKERLDDAMIEWAFAVQKSYRDDASPRDILERRDAIDALLAEVCELPEPMDGRVKRGSDTAPPEYSIMLKVGMSEWEVMSRELALSLAAALIRAATAKENPRPTAPGSVSESTNG